MSEATECPEDHGPFDVRTERQCPVCSSTIELVVPFPKLPCCFVTASNTIPDGWGPMTAVLPRGKYVVIETAEGWQVYGSHDPSFT